TINAVEVLKSVTKPIEQAVEFLPSDERAVRVGDRAQHRKFKVTGDVVSIDGKKAVLNVNGRRMTVEVKDLSRVVGQAPSPVLGRTGQAGEPVLHEEIADEFNLILHRLADA